MDYEYYNCSDDPELKTPNQANDFEEDPLEEEEDGSYNEVYVWGGNF